MGAACCAFTAKTFIQPPKEGMTMTDNEVLEILKKVTKCENIILYDSIYSTIERDEVVQYLRLNVNYGYVKEKYDCDNYSNSLMTRIHEWAYPADNKGGLLFGILNGDLRLEANADSRPHSVCFFIDHNKEFFIVDGMYNHLLKFEEFMTAWSIIV